MIIHRTNAPKRSSAATKAYLTSLYKYQCFGIARAGNPFFIVALLTKNGKRAAGSSTFSTIIFLKMIYKLVTLV